MGYDSAALAFMFLSGFVAGFTVVVAIAYWACEVEDAEERRLARAGSNEGVRRAIEDEIRR